MLSCWPFPRTDFPWRQIFRFTNKSIELRIETDAGWLATGRVRPLGGHGQPPPDVAYSRLIAFCASAFDLRQPCRPRFPRAAKADSQHSIILFQHVEDSSDRIT